MKTRNLRWVGRSLPELAMSRPVAVSMLLITLIGLGVIAAQRTAVEFLPPMDLPFLGAFIPYLGATPAQVEQEIAIPAEGQFRTLPNLREMHTNSNTDGCFITLNFEWGTDMTDALAEVRDRMERLRLVLPESADRIFVRHFSLSTIPVMQIGLSREGDHAAFAELVDREVVDKLLRLDGVADVEVFGYDEKMIMIDLDQQSMLAHNVSMYELITKLITANVDAGVGELKDGETKYQVRTLSPVTTVSEYANLNLGPGLRLSDVAQGAYRARDPEFHLSIDGQREMFLLITKESEANTVATCAAVIEELDRILESPIMEGAEKHVFFNQGDIIVEALNGLKQAAGVGGVMALLVLFAFLRRIRSTLIVALAIPGSIVAAFVFMFASGMTLNLITMMSMIVAIGLVVDNSIVVIDNIYRHQEMGKNAHDSARDGASEVALAIVAATSTTAVVFLPVFFLQSGQMAVFTRQFAVPVTVSLGASLILALTLIPLAVSRLKHYEDSPMERYRRWSEA
ncbi:MAG: efflux RND transporter permease subunit, partial [Candidatus Hydrogenedentes bacterium]|nr:efflux RND transporter permease subunit [Candidatus Hydrogenedentota bacterium]